MIIFTALATLAIAAGLVPLIQRDLKRAAARRRRRLAIRRLGSAAGAAGLVFVSFAADAVKFAAAMEATAAQIRATMRGGR